MIYSKSIFATLLMSIFLPTQAFAAIESKNATVVSCNDGDTCKVKLDSGEEIKVRLVGIDAPETRGSKKKAKGRQPYSLEAKEYLNNMVANKKIVLRSYGPDAFGRTLGDLIVQGKSANMDLIKQGFAECYRGKPPKGYSSNECDVLQNAAQKEKRGVWSLSNYESPKDFRKKK